MDTFTPLPIENLAAELVGSILHATRPYIVSGEMTGYLSNRGDAIVDDIRSEWLDYYVIKSTDPIGRAKEAIALIESAGYGPDNDDATDCAHDIADAWASRLIYNDELGEYWQKLEAWNYEDEVAELADGTSSTLDRMRLGIYAVIRDAVDTMFRLAKQADISDYEQDIEHYSLRDA